MTRLFIEDKELDIDKELINRVTYAIDDLEKLDTKVSTFSKTIILPGTTKNNKILGNIFDFNNSNFTNDLTDNVDYNFNAARSAKARIYVNGLQILKGTFRLLEIHSDNAVIEYEAFIVGELGGFSSAMGNKKIDELDFSAYDHIYSIDAITASWDKSGSPFTLTIFSFTAATKIITFFSDVMSLFPAVGSQFTVSGSASNDGTYTVALKNSLELTVVETLVDEGGTIPYPEVTFASVFPLGTGIFYPLIDYGVVSTGPPYGVYKHDYNYTALRPALYVKEYIDKIITTNGYTWESNFFGSQIFNRLVIPNNQKELYKNGSLLLSIQAYNNSLTFPFDTIHVISFDVNTFLGNFTTGDNITYTNGGPAITVKITIRIIGNYYVNAPSAHVAFSLGNADTKEYTFQDTSPTGSDLIPFDIEYFYYRNFTTGAGATSEVSAIIYGTGLDSGAGDSVVINIESLSVLLDKYPPENTPAAIGDNIEMNITIPKGILQKDFFSSILKMFYLLVTEDKFIENKLIIEPYVDFFNTDSSSYIDWSDKIDKGSMINIKPMSELNARYYQLKYRADNDFYNEQYRKKYNSGYGDRIFNSNYEFSKETETLELIFAASVLVGYDGEDKIVPNIYKKSNQNVAEDKMEHIIRILQVKKVDGVTSWNIQSGITVLASLTKYGYGGHLDDPDAPDADICFGAPAELEFALVSGNLSNNLFNAYYSAYLAEITDKDSRLLTAGFKLTDQDIYDLDFSKFIYLDGGLYRLNKVIDYAAGENGITKVELLRVIYTTY